MSTGPIDLAESVAGEEDPGASIDLTVLPGNQLPGGAPGPGDNLCPNCGGSGHAAEGDCPVCLGTGKVTVGIGGT
ncbi:MAG: hypothetical protein H0X13_08650 [Ramlibacter sp.]|nr:hypothetical protein [Ramlibacter sp.]